MFTLDITTNEGETIRSHTFVTRGQAERELTFVFHVEPSHVDFAMRVTEQNPGVPYDLFRLDEKGEINWTARLTKLHNCH